MLAFSLASSTHPTLITCTERGDTKGFAFPTSIAHRGTRTSGFLTTSSSPTWVTVACLCSTVASTTPGAIVIEKTWTAFLFAVLSPPTFKTTVAMIFQTCGVRFVRTEHITSQSAEARITITQGWIFDVLTSIHTRKFTSYSCPTNLAITAVRHLSWNALSSVVAIRITRTIRLLTANT